MISGFPPHDLRKSNVRKEEEEVAATEENGKEKVKETGFPLNSIGQVGHGLRHGAESGNAHPLPCKNFTNSNCAAPMCVGQCRLKSFLKESRACAIVI
jgi:hypothetical protein